MVGEVEKDGRVLIVKRINVTYRLRGVDEDQIEAVDRVLGFHADYCPVARSISPQIEIATSYELVSD